MLKHVSDFRTVQNELESWNWLHDEVISDHTQSDIGNILAEYFHHISFFFRKTDKQISKVIIKSGCMSKMI